MSNTNCIYFAGPLFSSAEKTFNELLAARFEQIGYTVFLPQRDGYEFAKLAELSQAEKTRKIFELDRDEVLKCDTFVYVLDGRVPDEGAAFELGLAYTHRNTQNERKILGLMTDVRASFVDQQLNPMLEGALDTIFYDQNALIDHLKNTFVKN